MLRPRIEPGTFQLSYFGFEIAEGDFFAVREVLLGGIAKQDATHHGQRR